MFEDEDKPKKETLEDKLNNKYESLRTDCYYFNNAQHKINNIFNEISKLKDELASLKTTDKQEENL